MLAVAFGNMSRLATEFRDYDGRTEHTGIRGMQPSSTLEQPTQRSRADNAIASEAAENPA
jgi:hypothetical protein